MFLIEKHDPYAPDDSGDERWECVRPLEAKHRWEDLTGDSRAFSRETIELAEFEEQKWTDPETGVEVTARRA